MSAFCLWVVVLCATAAVSGCAPRRKAGSMQRGKSVLCSLPDRVPLRAHGRPVSMRAAAAARLGDKSTACVLPVEQWALCMAASPLGSRIACGEAVLRFAGIGCILAGRLRLSTIVRMHESNLWCLGVCGGFEVVPQPYVYQVISFRVCLDCLCVWPCSCYPIDFIFLSPRAGVHPQVFALQHRAQHLHGVTSHLVQVSRHSAPQRASQKTPRVGSPPRPCFHSPAPQVQAQYAAPAAPAGQYC